MSWLQRYRIRSYVQQSIWILPLLAIVVAMISCRLVVRFSGPPAPDETFDPGATRDFLQSLANSTFTLIVFVSSALLLAVQLASAQLTPRVIGLFFRDPVTKLALAFFVFTFTFALTVAVRIGSTLPLFAARMAALSCLLSLALFLFMIDHVGRFLRPSGVLRVVGVYGRRVIEAIYPRQFDGSPAIVLSPDEALPVEPDRTILGTRGGVVLAMDIVGLVRLARRADCVIELVPQVGDFIAAGEPLFRIYQGGADLRPADLHQSVAVGVERTMEQDPAFAFRIIVDIASKGLSPAINDPTTAVLAIDQLHRLLRNVGRRKLDEGHVRDTTGRLRFVYRTPDWEEFVQLAITEIRHFGSVSIQVMRRLRGMIENLIHTLPEERRTLLRQELGRLRRSADRSFPEAEDRALAEVSDSQGVGGKQAAGDRSAGT